MDAARRLTAKEMQLIVNGQLSDLQQAHDISLLEAKQWLAMSYERVVYRDLKADPCDASIDFMRLESRDDHIGELARLRRTVLETKDGTFEPAALKASRLLAGVA